MPDEMTQEQFNKQLVGSLDSEFKASRNERAKMASAIAALQAPAAAAPVQAQPTPVGDAENQRMLEQLRDHPIDTFNGLLQMGEQKTKQAVAEALQAQAATQQQTQKNDAFWQDVWNQNQDVSDMQHQVYGFYNQTDPNQDPSDRANFAVQQVRTQIENRLKWSKEQERVQEEQKRMSSSAAMSAPWMNALRGGVGNPANAPMVDPKADLDEFVRESNAVMYGRARAADKVSTRPAERLTS